MDHVPLTEIPLEPLKVEAGLGRGGEEVGEDLTGAGRHLSLPGENTA